MNLTETQTNKIKGQLSMPYGVVYLLCDGYLVVAKVEFLKMKLHIAVYVNGYIRGADCCTCREGELNEIPEIPKRFFCRRKHPVNAKHQASLLKIWGKKAFNEKRLGEAWYTCMPWFNSPSVFLNHLKKHNGSIQVLDYEAYTDALEELNKGANDATQ